MQFKKVDVLISENLTKKQLKEKVLTELNKISKKTNPRISYIANIHDIVNGKYWICMDSETKTLMNAKDELIDLQAIFRHTTENPDEASSDLLYSSKYIEDNFLRKIIFETYKEANDSRLAKIETKVNTHTAATNNPHKTSIANLIDTSIVTPANNHILQYDANTRKWKNAVLSVDSSNYYNKSEVDSKLTAKANASNVYDKSEINTKLQDVLTQADNRYSMLLTQNLEWTVGEGGKFTNLNDALREALKYNKSNLIIIKLKSGFVFNEKIVFSNANFNNVIIRSEDAIVKVNPNNVVFSDTSVSYLFLSNYSITPIIDIKVDLNPSENSNSTKKIVFLGLYQNSRGIIAKNKGCMNAVWDAIMVEQASTLFADNCIIENAGYDGVFCSKGSIVNISNATIKNTTRYGILAREGGYICANNANILDQTKGTLLQCEGGIIHANGLVTTGSTATQTNITPNQPASSGIIFK